MTELKKIVLIRLAVMGIPAVFNNPETQVHILMVKVE